MFKLYLVLAMFGDAIMKLEIVTSIFLVILILRTIKLHRSGNVHNNPSEQGRKRRSICTRRPTNSLMSSSENCIAPSATTMLAIYRRQIRLSMFLKRCNNMDLQSETSLNDGFIDATQHLDEAFNQEPSPFSF